MNVPQYVVDKVCLTLKVNLVSTIPTIGSAAIIVHLNY